MRLPAHLVPDLAAPLLWVAAVVGCLGVAAGIIAVSRGARPPVRWLLAAAFIAVAAFTVLPPAGSTDSLDYAAYGRIVVLGHNPYLMTPAQLRSRHDPIGEVAPKMWQHANSVYGPMATAEQWAAAELGGRSALAVVFWLKLLNALLFGAVALILDRLLRSDPARRAQAHLLWTVNPLLLWCLIAGGHIDGLAAGVGFLGLVALRVRPPETRPAVSRALAAGLLVGAAVDIKVVMALYGLGVAWACRRSLTALAAAAAGALVVLVPSYLWAGPHAVTALSSRRGFSSTDNIYEFFARPFGYAAFPHVTRVSTVVFIVVALLLLWRLPHGFPSLPAVQPALAFSLAWLVTWPYHEPWYEAMAFCLLALYPASRLDWPVLASLTSILVISLPGGGRLIAEWAAVAHLNGVLFVPVVRLAVIAAIVWLCLSRAWRAHPPVLA